MRSREKMLPSNVYSKLVPETRPETRLYQCIQGMQTVQDIINHFKLQADHSILKFIKCSSQCNTGIGHDPYELDVIHPTFLNDVAPPFSIISAASVVQVSREGTSDIMALSDFLRESASFKTLREIGFFKYYAHRKYLQRLAMRTRQKRFLVRRSMLQEKLLFVREPFRDFLALTHIRGRSIANVPLISSISSSVDLEDFICSHQNVAEAASSDIRGFQDEILDFVTQVEGMVAKACRDDETMQLRQLRKKRIDRKTQLRYSSNARNRDTLSSFRRLVSYLCSQAVNEALSVAQKQIISIADSTVPIINISVNLTVSGLELTPTLSEIEGSLDETWRETLTRIRALDTSRRSTSPSYPDVIRTLAIIREQYKCIPLDGLRKLVDMKLSSEASTDFPNFTNGYDRALEVKIHQAEVKNTPFKLVSGIFSLDADNIKEELTASLEHLLDRIAVTLVNIAGTEVREVLEKTVACIKKIERKPATLEEYMSFLQDVAFVREKGASLCLKKEELLLMFEKLTELGIKVPKDDSLTLSVFESKLNELVGTTTRKAQDDIDSKRQSLMKDIQEQTDKLSKEGAQALEEWNETFNRADVWEAVPARIQDISAIWAPRVQAMSLRGSMLVSFSEKVGAVPSEVQNVNELVRSVETTQGLLVAIAEFQDVCKIVSSSDCSKLNVPSFEKLFSWLDFDFTTSGQATPLQKQFQTALRDWRDSRLPLLHTLRNSAIKRHHWDALFTELGINTMLPVTVGQLEERGVFSKNDFIQTILDRALEESAVSSERSLLMKRWADRALVVDKEESSEWILNTFNQMTLRDLRDDILWLQSNAKTDGSTDPDLVSLRDAYEILERVTSVQSRIQAGIGNFTEHGNIMRMLHPRVLASDCKVLAWFESIPDLFTNLAECEMGEGSLQAPTDD